MIEPAIESFLKGTDTARQGIDPNGFLPTCPRAWSDFYVGPARQNPYVGPNEGGTMWTKQSQTEAPRASPVQASAPLSVSPTPTTPLKKSPRELFFLQRSRVVRETLDALPHGFFIILLYNLEDGSPSGHVP